MNKLLEENISWDAVENDSETRLECEIDEAFISKETGVLTVAIGLNFIVPLHDDNRIKEALKRPYQISMEWSSVITTTVSIWHPAGKPS